MRTRRLIGILLTLAMVLSLLPAVSFPAYADTDGAAAGSELSITVQPKEGFLSDDAPSLTLRAACSGGEGGFTFQWYRGSSPISGAVGPSYTVTEQGRYSCTVTDAGGHSVKSKTAAVYDDISRTCNFRTYVWSGNYRTVTAYGYDAYWDNDLPYVYAETKTLLYTETVETTVETGEDGSVTYTAVFANSAFPVQSRTVYEPFSLIYAWDFDSEANTEGWTFDGLRNCPMGNGYVYNEGFGLALSGHGNTYYENGGRALRAEDVCTNGDGWAERNWAYSPAVTLPENAVLVFWTTGTYIPGPSWQPDPLQKLNVYCGEDMQNMTQVASVDFDRTTDGEPDSYKGYVVYDIDDYRQYVIDLSAYAGKTVYLKFALYEHNGECYIDNVQIRGVDPRPVITGVEADRTAAAVGTAVTWTARAESSSGTLKYRFYVYKDGAPVQKGEYGKSASVTYTPTEPGIYTVRAYAKNDTSSVNFTGGEVSVGPAAPTDVKVVSTLEGITVRWSPVDGAAKYRVIRTVDGVTTKIKVTGTAWTDTNVEADKSYTYSVQAQSEGGIYSPASETKSLYYPLGIAVKVSGKKASVTWTAVVGAAKYQMYRRPQVNGKYGDWVLIYSGKATAFTDTPGKGTWQYRVRAVVGTKKTGYSNRKKITIS